MVANNNCVGIYSRIVVLLRCLQGNTNTLGINWNNVNIVCITFLIRTNIKPWRPPVSTQLRSVAKRVWINSQPHIMNRSKSGEGKKEEEDTFEGEDYSLFCTLHISCCSPSTRMRHPIHLAIVRRLSQSKQFVANRLVLLILVYTTLMEGLLNLTDCSIFALLTCRVGTVFEFDATSFIELKGQRVQRIMHWLMFK